MRYEIILAPEAVEDLNALDANTRAQVHDALERHLRHAPDQLSKSRIKRLQGFLQPQYRLRVADEIRVFYDIVKDTVEVLAIISKTEANEWLEREGERDEEGPDV